jgi:hypothetical protein
LLLTAIALWVSHTLAEQRRKTHSDFTEAANHIGLQLEAAAIGAQVGARGNHTKKKIRLFPFIRVIVMALDGRRGTPMLTRCASIERATRISLKRRIKIGLLLGTAGSGALDSALAAITPRKKSGSFRSSVSS